MSNVTRRARPSRLALAATASLAALSLSATAASADTGIASGSPFRLNTATLEPGCSLASDVGSPVAGHIDVTGSASDAHVTVRRSADFSIDQVLVPSEDSGYSVYNTFETGSAAADPKIDPGQTAFDMNGPDGSDVVPDEIIVCINSHRTGPENEPYVPDGLPGQVAASNRAIIQPIISALGVSPDSGQRTYKVGFGYSVQRHYDLTWHNVFGGGDPDASSDLSTVTIDPQAKAPGVQRTNDFDEFGEQFNGPVVDYNQPTVFNVGGSGDPFAYLHSPSAVMSFNAEGDLPLTWSLKPSLAPQSYMKSVTLTDDMLRAWNQSWQSYYQGKGPKPTMPLAPGTDSPAPNATVIVNLPESANAAGQQKPVSTTSSATTSSPPAGSKVAASSHEAKAKIRSVKLVGKGKARHLRVNISSSRQRERVLFRLYGAKGHKMGEALKSVATGSTVTVRMAGAANAKSVNARLIL
jgi:hypothetical protein